MGKNVKNEENERKRRILWIIVFLLLCIGLILAALYKSGVLTSINDKNAPIITIDNRDWSKEVLVTVIKDAVNNEKELRYYEYCLSEKRNTNSCEWIKTETKNAVLTKSGTYYVTFRGIFNDETRSKISNQELVKIDNNNPKIEKIDKEEITENSIKVLIHAIDSESGVVKYLYSIDGKKYQEGEKEYKFTGLNKTTNYTIYVKVVDKVGNTYITSENIKTARKGEIIKPTGREYTSDFDPNDTDDPNNSNKEPEIVYDIPEIDLNDVPIKINFKDSYKLPSNYNFGNDEGTVECKVENEVHTDTKTIPTGQNLITCKAVSNHNKVAIAEKIIDVDLDIEPDTEFDGWIKLSLVYPANSTNREWRLGKEDVIRTGYEDDSWKPYTGPVLIRIEDVGNVYIRYDLPGGVKKVETPEDKVLVDIEPEKYTLNEGEKTKIKILYEDDALTKEYRINGGEWISYTKEFEVIPDTLIEARSIKEVNVYDKYGSVKYKKKKMGTDQVYISKFVKTDPTKDDNNNTTKPDDKEKDGKEKPDGKDNGNGSGGSGTDGGNGGSGGGSGSGSGSGEGGGSTPDNPTNPDDSTNPDDEDKTPIKKVRIPGNPDPVPITVPSTRTTTQAILGPEIIIEPKETLTEKVKVTLKTEYESIETYYKEDNGEWILYIEPFDVKKNEKISAYYIRKEDGKRSQTTIENVDNIKQQGLPYVKITANPNTFLTEPIDEVKVTISGSDYNTLEYSLDGIVYEPYTGEITITSSTTVYAKGTNKKGETIESMAIVTNTPPIKVNNLEIEILPNPTEGYINKTTVAIIYAGEATDKYYKIGEENWMEYNEPFEVDKNTTIYAYCKGNYKTGEESLEINFLKTEINEPEIIIEPSEEETNEVKVTINYDENANEKKYKIDEEEYIDYTEPFKLTKNATIYAYNKDILENENQSKRTVFNLKQEKQPEIEKEEIVILDEGMYYLITLNYPETAIEGTEEYKYKEDGVWKSYNTQGIVLIKAEYAYLLENVVDGVKVTNKNGEELTFTDHYYLLDGDPNELHEDLYMRWQDEELDYVDGVEAELEVINVTHNSVQILINPELMDKYYYCVSDDLLYCEEETNFIQSDTGNITISNLQPATEYYIYGYVKYGNVDSGIEYAEITTKDSNTDQIICSVDTLDWAQKKIVTCKYPSSDTYDDYYRINNGDYIPADKKQEIVLYENSTVEAKSIEIKDEDDDDADEEDIEITSTIIVDKIDNEKPIINDITVNNDVIQSTDRKVTITSSDTESGIKGYKVLTNFEEEKDVIEVSDSTFDIYLDNGEYIIYVVDNAGNISEPSNVVVTNIDKTGPTDVKLEVLATTYNSITVYLTGEDKETGIKNYAFSIDGETFTETNSNLYTFEGLESSKAYQITGRIYNNVDLYTEAKATAVTEMSLTPKCSVNKTGWAQEKEVTCIYPYDANYRYAFKVDAEEYSDKGIIKEGSIEKIVYRLVKNSVVYAKLIDEEGKEYETRLVVDKIDRTIPTKPLLNYDGVDTYSIAKPPVVPSGIDYYEIYSSTSSTELKDGNWIRVRFDKNGNASITSTGRRYSFVRAVSNSGVVGDISDYMESVLPVKPYIINTTVDKVVIKADYGFKSKKQIKNYTCKIGTNKSYSVGSYISDSLSCEFSRDTIGVSLGINSYYTFIICANATDGKEYCSDPSTAKTVDKLYLSDVAYTGAFVAYDAGEWSEEEYSKKPTDSTRISFFNSSTIKDADPKLIFGGTTKGKDKKLKTVATKNENAIDSKAPYVGWRISSYNKSTKDVSLVHAGTPEYVSYVSSNYVKYIDYGITFEDYLDKHIDSTYVNKEYAKSGHQFTEEDYKEVLTEILKDPEVNNRYTLSSTITSNPVIFREAYSFEECTDNKKVLYDTQKTTTKNGNKYYKETKIKTTLSCGYMEKNTKIQDTYNTGKYKKVRNTLNDVLNIGTKYIIPSFVKKYSSSTNQLTGAKAYYIGANNTITVQSSSKVFGIRPVVDLYSKTYAVGGNGTVGSPYIIASQDWNPDENNAGKYLIDVAKTGDYVVYDAGNWSETVTLPPDSNVGYGKFGGYFENDSRSNSVGCTNIEIKNSTSEYNFRVVESNKNTDTLTIAHSGVSECYRYNKNYLNGKSTPDAVINERLNNLYLNDLYAESVHGLNTSDFEAITGRSIDTCHISDKCGEGTVLGSKLSTLVLSESSTKQYKWSGTNYLYETKSKMYGIKPVVKLLSNVKIARGTGKKFDPYILQSSVIPDTPSISIDSSIYTGSHTITIHNYDSTKLSYEYGVGTIDSEPTSGKVVSSSTFTYSTDGEKYIYVRSKNLAGNYSRWSNYVVSYVDGVPPTKPGITIDSNEWLPDKHTITITTPSTAKSNIDFYEYGIGSSSSTPTEWTRLNQDVMTFDITDLGKKYVYVRATSGANLTNTSNYVISKLELTPPIVSLHSTNPTPTSWIRTYKVNDAESGIKKYICYFKTSSATEYTSTEVTVDLSPSTTPTKVSCSNTGLNPGTTYNSYISVFNDNGDMTTTSPISATLPTSYSGVDLIRTASMITKSEVTTLYVNGQSYKADIHYYDQDTTLSSSPCDSYEDRMCIIKVDGDLTTTGTITPSVRKKGFFIYTSGTLTNNGTITMTARGSQYSGQDVYLWKKSNGNYEYVPATGAYGGILDSCTKVNNFFAWRSNSGDSGYGRRTGGGGSGGARSFQQYSNKKCSDYSQNEDVDIYCSAGRAGSSYAGGSGGGATPPSVKSSYTMYCADYSKSNRTSFSAYGGSGGGVSYTSEVPAPGGAGVYGGTGSAKNNTNGGSSGAGGLIIIYANVMNNRGTISSSGSQGGSSSIISGGGSGGGSINIFYTSVSSYGSSYASGGASGNVTGSGTKIRGGYGGDGSVTWTQISYSTPVSVNFDSQGGSSINSISVMQGLSLSSLPKPTRAGYTFDGWYTEIEGGEKLTTSQVINDSATYYAHWVKNAVLTFDSQGGTSVSAIDKLPGYTVSELPSPTKDHSVFLGWYTEPSGGERLTTETVINEDVTYYAQWNPAIIVTFDSQGGTNVDSRVILPNSTMTNLPSSTKQNYNFAGWYTLEDGGERLTTETVISEDVTYYAHWVEPLPLGDVVYFDPVSSNECNSTTFNLDNIINGSSTCYKWRVIGTNNALGKLKLQLDHNISNLKVAWVDSSDYGEESVKNNKGPITAIKALQQATNNWERLELLNYEYDTSAATNNYGKLSCVNGSCTVSSTGDTIVENLRTRLVTAEEIRDIVNTKTSSGTLSQNWTITGSSFYISHGSYILGTNSSGIGDNTSFSWLMENTKPVLETGATDNQYGDSISGYWMLTPTSSSNTESRPISGNSGKLHSYAVSNSQYYGIRPVIEIPYEFANIQPMVTITYNYNGITSTRNYELDSEVQLPTSYKTNYDFVGWYTEETGGTKVENLIASEPKTLYARFKEFTYGTLVYFDPTSSETQCSSENVDSNASTCMKWRVINPSGTNITIQLDHNLINKGAWNSIHNTVYGPETALAAMASLTSSWNNVSLLNYSYNTQGYGGYDLLSCTNGTCTASKYSDTVATNVRARMITVEEIVNLTYTQVSSVDWSQSSQRGFYFSYTNGILGTNTYRSGAGNINLKWLVENTSASSTSGATNNSYGATNNGYWTMTPYTPVSGDSYGVNQSGSVSKLDATNSTYYGVRPVIAVPKSSLSY